MQHTERLSAFELSLTQNTPLMADLFLHLFTSSPTLMYSVSIRNHISEDNEFAGNVGLPKHGRYLHLHEEIMCYTDRARGLGYGKRPIGCPWNTCGASGGRVFLCIDHLLPIRGLVSPVHTCHPSAPGPVFPALSQLLSPLLRVPLSHVSHQ